MRPGDYLKRSLIVIVATCSLAWGQRATTSFSISFDPFLGSEPLSGRIILMLSHTQQFLPNENEPSRCIYCGSKVNAGGSCGKSPSRSHVVDAGPMRCVYCGAQVNPGGSCSRSPSKGHVLGGGGIF